MVSADQQASQALATTLTRTPQERSSLERVRNRDRRPYLRERAATLLKIAEGASPRSVALHGLLRRRKPDTVYTWLREYQSHRCLEPRPAFLGVRFHSVLEAAA